MLYSVSYKIRYMELKFYEISLSFVLQIIIIISTLIMIDFDYYL